MDYQKSKRQKRILGNGKMSNTNRPVDQPGERPMAQQRVPNWYDGKSKASATVKSSSSNATRRQFENAFGSKATGGIKSRNSNTGNVTEQKTEKKPSWYSGSKTKAKATVRGKNG